MFSEWHHLELARRRSHLRGTGSVAAQLAIGTARPWTRHCATSAPTTLGQHGPAGRLRSLPDFIQVSPGGGQRDARLQPADDPNQSLRLDAEPLLGLIESQR